MALLDEQLRLTAAPPRFWRDETSGILAAAVTKYLTDHTLTPNEIRYMRAYLVQWVGSPVWDLNPAHDDATRKELEALRDSAKRIHSIQQLDRWLRDALDVGIDPL